MYSSVLFTWSFCVWCNATIWHKYWLILGMILQVVHSPDALKWQVYAAPEPREVIWSNLAKPVSQRALRKAIVYVVVFLIILFFMIPILFISALTTLNNLETLLPFIKAIVKIKALTAVIQVNHFIRAVLCCLNHFNFQLLEKCTQIQQSFKSFCMPYWFARLQFWDP